MRVLTTIQVKVVAPNPNSNYKLIEFLKAFHNWTQNVVDQIWLKRNIPSIESYTINSIRY